MDSEDSQNSLSGNDSNDEGCQTPVSTKSQGAASNKSIASRSRSSSPESRAHSVSSQHSQNDFSLQEGPHSPVDSYHSKNGNHSDESQHSLDDSCHSQEQRGNLENIESSTGNQNSSLRNLNTAEEECPSPDKHQSSKEDVFPEHSPINSNSSPEPSEDKQMRETEDMEETSVNIKNTRRSHSSSFSSNDNDDKSSTDNHIPKSPNNFKNVSKTDSEISSHYLDKDTSKAQNEIDSKIHMSDNEDNDSVKSDSSTSSRSSRCSGKSVRSANSSSTNSGTSRKSRKKSESSASSASSESSNHKKGTINSPDTHAEEISDGKDICILKKLQNIFNFLVD